MYSIHINRSYYVSNWSYCTNYLAILKFDRTSTENVHTLWQLLDVCFPKYIYIHWCVNYFLTVCKRKSKDEYYCPVLILNGLLPLLTGSPLLFRLARKKCFSTLTTDLSSVMPRIMLWTNRYSDIPVALTYLTWVGSQNVVLFFRRSVRPTCCRPPSWWMWRVTPTRPVFSG